MHACCRHRCHHPPNRQFHRKELPPAAEDERTSCVTDAGCVILMHYSEALDTKELVQNSTRVRNYPIRLPELIHPSDHCPFLLAHVGTNDTARKDAEQIRGDEEALGQRIKEHKWCSCQFFLWKTRVQAETILWLRGCCQHEGFSFVNNRQMFMEGGLQSRDGIHLTKMGNSIFEHCLANLVRVILQSLLVSPVARE